jgi:outer membrane protein, heavy metal efflux system
LRVLVGRPADEAMEIADDLSNAGGIGGAGAPDLETIAMQARPDLKALQLTQARTVADLHLQEALGKVDYTVGAEYRRQQGIAGRSNSLGVFFSAPLPISNRNQGEIARADAERGQAERQIAARQAQISADVRSALHEYETTRDLVATIEHDLLAPAAHARDISAYTYKAGGATLLELLDAQRAFNDTMQSYVDARASLRRAIARLNAAVGTEVAQ